MGIADEGVVRTATLIDFIAGGSIAQIARRHRISVGSAENHLRNALCARGIAAFGRRVEVIRTIRIVRSR